MRATRFSVSIVAVACLAAALASGSALAGDKGKGEKALKDAIAAKDAAAVEKACDELIETGGVESLNVILGAIAKSEGSFYWQLVGAAAGFRDRAGLEELGKQIVSKQNEGKSSLSRDLIFSLQNNSYEVVAIPLGLVLEKGKYDIQLMATDQLALMRCVDSMDALVAALKREEKGDQDLKRRVLQALVALVGEDKGDSANWEGWWKNQRATGVPPRKEDDSSGQTGSKPRDRELKKVVETLPPGNVIVLAARDEFSSQDTTIQGDMDFDDIQAVLKQCEVPHTVVSRQRFEENPDKFLKDCVALLVNCHQISEFCICPKCHPGKAERKNRLNGPCEGCTVHNKVSFRLKKPAVDRIKAWVENEGGFLYTEDWGLVEITGACWPEMINSGSGGKPNLIRRRMPDGSGFCVGTFVKLTPSRGNTSHPLMRGVWQKDPKPPAPQEENLEPQHADDPAPAPPKAEPEPGTKGNPGAPAPPKPDGKTGTRPPPPPVSPAKKLEHRWLVDDESPTIEIHDTSNVVSLLESEELAQLDGGFPVVAVTFRFGKRSAPPSGGGTRGSGEWAAGKGGRVLHTLSHFGHTVGTDDGKALHNLIVNFLLEAQKHHEAPAKK
ncbi:hypothetical protein HY251_04415 [bacterium]|nr:hypothetical protein [bacterium]